MNAARAKPVTYVKPATGLAFPNIAEVCHYRDLVWQLAARDVSIRYRQTAIGASWAILQPLLMMAVFYVIFARAMGVTVPGIPYPLFALSGLLVWQYFSTTVSTSVLSLSGNSSLITKAYFPKLVIPLASIMPAAFDFVITFLVLLALLLASGRSFTMTALFAPVYLLLAAVTTLGCCLWLSALNVQFRDVKYVVQYLLQLGIFATPVAYPLHNLPPTAQLFMSLNPVATAITGFRHAVFANAPAPEPTSIIVSSLVAVALAIGGAIYFRTMERTFADLV